MFKFYVRAVRYFVFSLFLFFYLLLFTSPYTFPEVKWGHTQNFDPIGPTVLTFIGYKQTNKHPDTQSIYINIDCNILFVKLFPNKFLSVLDLKLFYNLKCISCTHCTTLFQLLYTVKITQPPPFFKLCFPFFRVYLFSFCLVPRPPSLLAK